MIISSLKNVTQHEQIKKLKQKRKIPDRNNYRIHPLNKKGQCPDTALIYYHEYLKPIPYLFLVTCVAY